MDDFRSRIIALKEAAGKVVSEKTEEELRNIKLEAKQEAMRQERLRHDPRDIIFAKINDFAKKGYWEEIVTIHNNEKSGFIKQHALKSISSAVLVFLDNAKQQLKLVDLVKIELNNLVDVEAKNKTIVLMMQIADRAIDAYYRNKNSDALLDVAKTKQKDLRDKAGKVLVKLCGENFSMYYELIKLANASREYGEISFYAGSKLLEVLYSGRPLDPDFILRARKDFNYAQFQTFFYHLIESDTRKHLEIHKKVMAQHLS